MMGGFPHAYNKTHWRRCLAEMQLAHNDDEVAVNLVVGFISMLSEPPVAWRTGRLCIHAWKAFEAALCNDRCDNNPQ